MLHPTLGVSPITFGPCCRDRKEPAKDDRLSIPPSQLCSALVYKMPPISHDSHHQSIKNNFFSKQLLPQANEKTLLSNNQHSPNITSLKMQFQIIVLFTLIAAVFAVPVPEIELAPRAPEATAEAIADPGCSSQDAQACF
jgi:hypothetical protein